MIFPSDEDENLTPKPADQVDDYQAEELEPLQIDRPRAVEEEIIFSALSNHDPLPMLDVIFSRLAGGLSPMLKSQNGFLSDTIEQPISYENWERSTARLAPNSTVVIANSVSLAGPLVLALDGVFLHSAMAVMLGGKSEDSSAISRPATVIERAFAQRLLQQLIDELAQHMSRIVDVSFKLDSVEAPSQIVSLLAGSAQVARGSLSVSINGVVGLVTILFPLDSLEPVRAQLGKMFLGEKLGSDASWRDHFEGQINHAAMQVEVELTRVDVSLADILQWRPGVTVDLGVTLDQEAVLRCSGIPILNGQTGRKRNGKMALRITGEYSDTSESADDDLITD